MNKALFPLITAMLLIMSFSTACAEQDNDTAKQLVGNGVAESIMDQPVDFSSAEAAEATLQKIREQEGEAAYTNVKSGMDFVLFYDLSVNKDKAKLYKKLDGKTPNQIIAKARR